MTSINKQLGLRPGGKRAFMKLPTDRAAAARLTAAICPKCGHRGARESKQIPGSYWCSQPGCGHTWNPDAGECQPALPFEDDAKKVCSLSHQTRQALSLADGQNV
jgi:hypothetical protein